MKHILLFFLVFAAVICSAETKNQAKHPQPQRQTTPQYDTKPFDVSRETLPPNYLGNDFVTVVRKLLEVESSLQKSDYETTDAFNARRAAANDVFLVSAPDPTAFVVRVHQKYWADTRILEVWVNLLSTDPAHFKGTTTESIHLDVDMKDIKTYQAANAFGAERTVLVSDMTYYSLAMPSISSNFRVAGGVQEADALLVRRVISPVDALELRDSVRALVVVRLEPPYVYHWDTYSAPTFTSPSDDTRHDLVIYVRPIALWFFNSKTGAILEKVSISPSARSLSTNRVHTPPCTEGGEVAVLHNGFTIRHERRETIGDNTRLYFDEGPASFIDVPTDDIEVEKCTN